MAVLLLAVSGVGYAGWYYSSELLTVPHGEDPFDLWVLDADANSVTLPRTEETTQPGTYGLRWPGGSAVLGAIESQDGDSVTRGMSLVSPGAPSGEADMNRAVWNSDPARDLGLAFRSVAVPTPLGDMPAWHVPARGKTWAVLVHGRGGSRAEGLRVMPALHRAGLPVLAISYRNDEGAPTGPDGLYHLGHSEWRDLEAAVRYARAEGAQRVVLYGYSMGGAIVGAFLDRSAQAEHVAAVVLDAPVADWRATLDLQAAARDLPSPLTTVAEFIVERRIGIDFDEFDLPRHGEQFRRPTLVFHGTDDSTVPIGPSRAFARRHRDVVTFSEVAGAEHTGAWNVDPARYERQLTDFLADAL